jgi:hypothetical protein
MTIRLSLLRASSKRPVSEASPLMCACSKPSLSGEQKTALLFPMKPKDDGLARRQAVV